MIPIDTIDFPDIIMCMQDDASLYLLSEWKSQVLLSTIDPVSFKVISRFTLSLPINHLVKSVVDDNCIYIPTMRGEVIGVDKFSGEKIAHCDLGMMTIVSNVEQDDKFLYTICGLPIVHGLKTDTEIFCVTSSDKLSGKKTGQGPITRGKICSITAKHGHIWALTGKVLYKYSSLCEEISKKELQFSPNYQTLVTDDYVCSASNRGSLEIFNKDDLDVRAKFILGVNNSPPVWVSQNIVYWFIGKDVYLIDLDDKKITKKYELENKVVSTPTVHSGNIYASDRKGNLIKISSDIDQIHVADGPFRQPMIFDNYALMISKEKIYRVKI